MSSREIRMLDVSPDAAEMLALKQDLNVEITRGSLWSVPVLGGYPRMLGNQMASSAHFSPDGRLIVYASKRALYLASKNAAEKLQLSTALPFTVRYKCSAFSILWCFEPTPTKILGYYSWTSMQEWKYTTNDPKDVKPERKITSGPTWTAGTGNLTDSMKQP